MAINLFVEVHGMNPNHNWVDHDDEFDKFRSAIQRQTGCVFDDHAAIHNLAYLVWGQEAVDPRFGGTPTPDDTYLRPGKAYTHDHVQFDYVQTLRQTNNHLLPWDLNPLNGPITYVKESIVLAGFADCAYYCSPDGESAIRRACYSKLLDQLDRYDEREDIHLHVVSHSLGVVISHDFLFGLFNTAPGYKPGYTQDPKVGPAEAQRFDRWRAKAQAGTLRVGSYTSYASQLPIFFCRKQDLLLRYVNGPVRTLSAQDIGIGRWDNQVRWQLFYDRKDPLGFPTRPLYGDDPAIEEFQVDNGLPPWSLETVHTGYLDINSSNGVFGKTCDLIKANWA